MNVPAGQAAALARLVASIASLLLLRPRRIDGAGSGDGAAGRRAGCGPSHPGRDRRVEPAAAVVVPARLRAPTPRGGYSSTRAECAPTTQDRPRGCRHHVGGLLRDDRPSPGGSFALGHLAGAVNVAEASASTYINALPSDVKVLACAPKTARRATDWPRRCPQGAAACTSLLGGIVEWQRQHGNLLLVASAP